MAQQTRTTLLSNLLVLFPNNATEFITPAKLREGLTNMIDSGLITLTDDSDDITEGAVQLFVTSGEKTAIGTAEQQVNKGVANGYASLGADAKVPASQIPDIAISEYLGAVADQTAMLALTGEKGDWCTRTDTGTNFIITGDNPTLLADWTELSYPLAPVTSVNGLTGVVVLDAQDIAEAGNRIWLLSGSQTISGNKTFSSPVTMNNTLTLDGNLLGDQSARVYRPVGTAISASANLEDLDPNTFYDVDASGGAVVITVTDAANSAFAIGTEFEFSPIDLTNDVSFIGSGSQTIESKDVNLKLDGVFSGSVLKKTAANTWRLIGTLKS